MKLTHEQKTKLAETMAKRQEQETALEKELSLYVRKSNDMIQKSRYTLSLREQRLLLYCISKIKPDDKGDTRYIIKLRDAVKICGYNENSIGGQAYNDVFDAFKILRDRGFTIPTEKGRARVAFIDNPEQDKDGNMEFNFNKYVVPYLFDVKKKFTQYNLRVVIKFRSTYGIRLYELLKSYQNLGEKIFTLDELRERLGAEEQSYKKYGLFRKNVLEQALKDIENSDLKVSYIEIKEGRKVTSLQFIISDDTIGYYEKEGWLEYE